MNQDQCNPEYLSKIISTLEDYFYFEENINSENLENYVKSKVKGVSLDFSLQTWYWNSEEFKDAFNNFMVAFALPLNDFIKKAKTTTSAAKSNVAPNFSSSRITDLFHTLPLIKANFEGKANKLILGSILIGDKSSDKFVTTDTEVSDNFTKLKNDLFIDIQKFLIDQGLLKKEVANLYNEKKDVINYAYYKKVMNLLDNHFFTSERYSLIDTFSKKKIPNLTNNTTKDADVINAYNAGILLSNFDTVLQEYYSGIIDINYNLFNNLRSNIGKDNKYTLKIEGLKTDYWLRDTHEAEGSESAESKLSKLLVSIIPVYNKKDLDSGMFMEMKDFYLLAAKISEYELLYGNALKNTVGSNFIYFNENPKESLLWFLNEIHKTTINAADSITTLKEHFQHNYEIANSLKRFLESPDTNILQKEANSDTSLLSIYSQIINNNFGASYLTYDANGKYTIREMYKQNFNNTQVQDVVFKHIARTANKSLYDVEKANAAIDEMLKGLPHNSKIRDISRDKKIEINNFIKARIGVHLSYLGFDDLVDDLENQKDSARIVLDVISFSNLLKGFIVAASVDNKIIKDAIKDGLIKDSSKGDVATSEYLPSIVNNKLFKGINNAYLINYIVKAVMNIETITGEKLPTFKLTTLTQKDPELFELQRNFQLKNTGKHIFESLLIKDTPVILGTGTKLEAINNEASVRAPKFNVDENFTSDFQYDFLQNIIRSSKRSNEKTQFSIMLGNYSDKNTILTKIINANFTYGDSKIPVIKLPMENLLALVKQQAGNFYRDAINDVIGDYKQLLDVKLTKDIEKNIAIINEVLRNTDVRTLSKKASDLGINLTEELHYSKYEGKFALNQLLVDNYRIFHDDTLFAEFIARQESSMLDKFATFTKKGALTFIPKLDIDTALTELGISKEDFDQKKVGEKEEADYAKLVGEKGVNPLLRKWMWINALYRNEYLFISAKGEYMHPHKLKDALKYRGNSSDFNSSNKEQKEAYWHDFQREMSGRLSSMAKRNVLYTATIEVPIRKSRFGVAENINMATIDDHVDNLYNIAGDLKKQEVHDGSTFMNYVYSTMLDNSLPGKGFSGTKKQFGTLITEHGVTIKKDAESVITNEKILNSTTAPISFYNKQKQMLNLPIGGLNYFFEQHFNNEFFFNDLGTQYRINKLTLTGSPTGTHTYKMIVSTKIDGQWVMSKDIKSGAFNSLFDLWELFGGQYSTDENGEFNEGSNDLLYRIVTTPDTEGNYPLKDKMIHIVSNISSVKAGGTNVNAATSWTNDADLGYFTFANRFMGPQLDSSHEADDSKIKEVTQVISALAQNTQTAHLAQEAYADIANVIKKAAAPYLQYMKIGENVSKEKLYQHLSEKFVRTIENSKGDTIAKILVQSFANDVRIPFSNQNFFVPFVRDVITRMNNELITRYYAGTGAVLIPSHGIIQLYDIPQPDGTIITVTQRDLMKDAFAWYSTLDTKILSSNNEILKTYLNNILPPLPTTWDKIQLGDTVLIDNTPITLSTPGIYYQYKGSKTIEEVKKVQNVARDLKPSNISFTINGIQKNLFDLDSVRIRYKLKSFADKIMSGEPIIDVDFTIFQNFYKHITDGRDFVTDFLANPKEINYANKLLYNWTKRNLELLDNNLIMKQATVIDNFNEILGTDKLLNTFRNVESFYKSNSIEIKNYKFDAAELILGDIYQTKFNRNPNDSLYKIKQENSNYFRKQLEGNYEPDDTEADIKLILNGLDTPVYIKYTDKLPGNDFKSNITLERPLDDEGSSRKYVRRNQKGELIYTIPDHENVRVVNEDGRETIYVKAAASTTNKKGKISDRIESFDKNLNKLIKSFNGGIKAFIPLMNNQFIVSKDPKLDFNKTTLRKFIEFSGYYTLDFKNLSSSWIGNNKEEIINQLSKKMFASWEKSHEFIAARIPAQSMQSFMEMRNIGYFNTDSNDAYVSIWQIWLQGSDFDIDKAYIMGYGFNKNGQYEIPSRYFDYSSKQELDALEKLPLPNGKTTTLELLFSSFELENELSSLPKITEVVKKDGKKDILNPNFSSDQIITFGKILRKIKNNELNVSEKYYIQNKDKVDLLLKFINQYNSDKTYIKKRNSIRNSIVSKIKQIISTPSNLILATQPVSIKSIHDAAAKSKEQLGFTESNLNASDTVSFFRMQQNAAVGKTNVGIGANGLKVFFALSNYYNSWHSPNNINDDLIGLDLYSSPKVFKKDFVINGKRRIIHNIANIDINEDFYDLILEEYGYDDLQKEYARLSDVQAALLASGFVSAATDNAKELVLAKINAVVELSAMHLYLISLGYSMDDIAIYMNSDLGKYVAKEVSGNIFLNPKEQFVQSIVDNYQKGSTDPNIIEEKRQFKEIYEASQEFKVLASILKVNQKATANILELNKFLSTLESAMYAREHAIFNKDLTKVRKSEQWLEKTTINDVKNISVVEHIINNNQLLSDLYNKNPKLATNYVVKVLEKANNIKVKYIDYDKQVKEKTVSLIGGQFDFQYYLHPDNHKYREATIEYYNLFKSTINIFDVIENSPHFKAMINGVSTIHNTLSLTSAKYNWMFLRSRELIRKHTQDIQSANRSLFKSKFGNPAFPMDITDDILAKAALTFDKFMVFSWLNSKGNIDNFRFNVKDMLKLAGISSMTFYKTIDAKNYSISDFKKNLDSIKNASITITTDEDSPDLIIDLKSEVGIANFKILMEDVILTILQKNNIQLGNNLKLTAVRNHIGLFTNQITSTFPISSLNSPVNIDKFQELLANFNEVDVVSKEKIRNPEGKLLSYKDLFYVYNLINNNESYGDKRLTPLFEDYIKNNSSLGKDYLKYATLADTAELDIFSIDLEEGSEEEIKMKQEIMNNLDKNLLFLLLHKRGQLNINLSKDKISVNNANFPLLISVDPSTDNASAKYLTAKSILSILKNRNFLINFNCD